MPDIQTRYKALLKNMETVKKEAEDLAAQLEAEAGMNEEFTALFLKGDCAKEAGNTAEAIGRAAGYLKSALEPQMSKFALRAEYEAVQRSRERLCSPSVHLLSLLKKAGAENTEPLSKAVLQGDAAEEMAAYSQKVAALSKQAADPEAFRNAFALKKKKAPDIAVGSIVKFGRYPQTKAGNDSTPIEWRVLEVKDGKALLISKYALDAKPYNIERTDVTWETCSLRNWLNGAFYEKAFSASEKEKIVLSTVENPDNKEFGTEGGNTTKDYVYLLSLDEVGRYFHVDPYYEGESEALICLPTQTAVNNGADTDNAGACWWWLRSPGLDQYNAAYVDNDGLVYVDGFDVDDVDCAYECVRPVVCARL